MSDFEASSGETAPPGAELLMVYDTAKRKVMYLDISGAEEFALEGVGENWLPIDEQGRRIFRLLDGRWFLVSGRTSPPGLEYIPPHVAAELLLCSGPQLPPELTEYVGDRFIVADPGRRTTPRRDWPKNYGPVQVSEGGEDPLELPDTESLCEYPDNRWFRFCERPGHWSDITPHEAAQWFRKHGMPLPPALADLFSTESKETDSGPGEDTKRGSSRISRTERNIKARDYLKKHAAREHGNNPVTVREFAEAIGCSVGTASSLPSFRAVMEERRKRGRGRAPKAVSLTDKFLASQGEHDPKSGGGDALQSLIREHQTNFEPSSLEESDTIVRARKRV
jgi:hypothetical protein